MTNLQRILKYLAKDEKVKLLKQLIRTATKVGLKQECEKELDLIK